MIVLSIVLFALLTSYLVGMGIKYGIPDMVSDTYYQGIHGKAFPYVLACVALGMMMCMLDMERGIKALAFMGCGGLMFVAACPTYLHCNECRAVHKGGAIVAAIGCIGWSLSVCWLPTLLIALYYCVYVFVLGLYCVEDEVMAKYTNTKGIKPHLWYWAEVAAFADAFISYWCANIFH